MIYAQTQHGGSRSGAGRPAGTGKWKGEPTQMMRVPVSRKLEVKSLLESQGSRGYCLNVFDVFVQAGNPTPLGDETSEKVDVMDFLTDHPADTFMVTAHGDSMINANIHSGDTLVVDAKIEAKEGSIVVASIDSEFTVKTLRKINGKHFLMPENPDFKPIPITPESEFKIYGVVRKKIANVG
jgi:DNA polymerase V